MLPKGLLSGVRDSPLPPCCKDDGSPESFAKIPPHPWGGAGVSGIMHRDG